MNRYFAFSLFLFCAALTFLDRRFLKANDGFCLQNIYGKLPAGCADFVSAPPEEWEEIAKSSFHYLKKGHQSYAFLSDNGKYVIKFTRFPSHFRPSLWSSHLFTAFGKKRQEINAYNRQKLQESFESYSLAYQELHEETGLLMVHLHPTSNLRKKVQLYDKLGAGYWVDLDQVLFLVQRRADLIFPRLDHLLLERKYENLEATISQIMQLISARCKKGIVDKDAMLEKNYGLLGNQAMQIDVGRFVHDESVKNRAREEVEKITYPLKSWCESKDPKLLQFYREKLQEI